MDRMIQDRIPIKLEEIKTVQDVNRILIRRYKLQLEAFCQGGKDSHDLNMCITLEENPDWPVDKVSRWIGYIQRGLIDSKWTTALVERNFSRQLFHKAYSELGYDIPETIKIS